MKFRIEKNGNSINFINVDTNCKFDYIEFADNLYNGVELQIVDYGTLTEDEKKVIVQTIKELNELSNPRKRRKIISQFEQ